jgi:hypothetical protein
MRYFLGDGTAAICAAHLEHEEKDTILAVIFDQHKREPGEDLPHMVGAEIPPDNSIEFHFSDVRSVEVMIRALEKIKNGFSPTEGQPPDGV